MLKLHTERREGSGIQRKVYYMHLRTVLRFNIDFNVSPVEGTQERYALAKME